MSRTDKCRIPVLTNDMRASFPEYVDKWTAIGRSTERLDQDRVIEGVRLAYAAAGLATPRIFFGSSPVGGAIMRQLIQDGVRAGVSNGVSDGVWAGVWAGVQDGVWAGFSAGVSAGVSNGVSNGVSAGVWAGVRDGVRDGVRAGVSAGVWDGVVYGCHDVGWLSYVDWFGHHGMADITQPAAGLSMIAQSAGWWWPNRGFVVVTDRPLTLHDERIAGTTHRRRLHNPDGPSVTYTDGWSVWHWHGQLVPEWVISNPTVELIAAEKNTEIRRCAIEKFGWDRYLDAVGVQPVSVEADPGNPGHELALYDLPAEAQVHGEDVRLLVMRNASRDRDGTRRTYAETVPATIQTAVDAAAWQFDTDPDVYRTLARAT